MKIKLAHVTFYTLSPVYTVCTTIHEFSAETNWQKTNKGTVQHLQPADDYLSLAQRLGTRGNRSLGSVSKITKLSN